MVNCIRLGDKFAFHGTGVSVSATGSKHVPSWKTALIFSFSTRI